MKRELREELKAEQARISNSINGKKKKQVQDILMAVGILAVVTVIGIYSRKLVLEKKKK